METTMFPTPVMIRIPSSIRLTNRSQLSTIVSVIRTPSSTDVLKTSATASTVTIKTVYKDNFFDRLAIDYLSKAVQDTVGMRNEESGYESLVVAARAVFRRFDPIQQRQIVHKALHHAIPPPFALLDKKMHVHSKWVEACIAANLRIKTLLPPSKFSREYFAAFTTIFFPWLVGPCQVKESEFEGSKESNVVHVKKCRFLESTNCAGMCTNLCKIPSQEFVKNSFGIPINMVPNFDDMSCDMIFGEDPPALQDDPVLKQPCYTLCNVKHKHDTSCVS